MRANLEQIMKLEVPIIVRLGERKMTAGEVLNLVPGAILELTRRADAELDLLVNNKQVGSGLAVKVGENFGLRITQVGDAGSRVAAISGAAPEPEAQNAPESVPEGAV